jgi:hypothetical protein
MNGVSIVPVEPVLRSEPHEAFRILCDACYDILGQAIPGRDMVKLKLVVLRKGGGKESERKGSAHEHPAQVYDSREFPFCKMLRIFHFRASGCKIPRNPTVGNSGSVILSVAKDPTNTDSIMPTQTTNPVILVRDVCQNVATKRNSYTYSLFNLPHRF